MSILSLFAGRAVTDLGVRLADDFAREMSTRLIKGRNAPDPAAEDALLEELLSHTGRESHQAPLNFLQRAKVAIAFKRRLLQNKIAPTRVDHLTRNLVVHLSANGGSLAPNAGGRTAAPNRAEAADAVDASAMRREADNLLSKGANAEAVAAYRRLLKRKPEDADALTHLAAALLNLDQVKEAIEYCQRAIQLKPEAAFAYSILSSALRYEGLMAESEAAARQALKLKPKDPGAL
ncbi:MAG: tetratricopeptide repeat protein, partial [Steroidobacteraceae bacterium]